MPTPAPLVRPLGTMIAYGFARGHLDTDLAIAERLRASLLEILPDWRSLPSPAELRQRVADRGLAVWSAHGCWGGQSIRAERVDLGHPETIVRDASVDDVKRCVDWLVEAGGQMLVVHPGGLSDPSHFEQRRQALSSALDEVGSHARGTGITVCVENMPPGVHPGSRMGDVAELVAEIDLPELGLALDTGHAQLCASPQEEAHAAGALLRTTHVHDNNGRSDTHEPPGTGSIDWAAWVEALDAIDYRGPVMLECIRHFREHPDSLNLALDHLLDSLTRRPGD
jgi:sugar phosphate isomerase/epimerase